MAKKKTIPGQEVDIELKPQKGRVSFELPARIFNPYDKDSYTEAYKEQCFSEIESVATIQNRLIRSNGLFGDHYGTPASDTIYVYKITGETAVLRLQQLADYTRNRVKDNYIAFAFYDKELKSYLDQWKKDSEKAIREEEYKTVYKMWHFGAFKRSELLSKKDWIVVPREIFSNIKDYVYLCICTEQRQGAPVLERVTFPKDRLFFYDEPVATSVYKGQILKDSKILLGKVMCHSELWKMIKILEEKKWTPKSLSDTELAKFLASESSSFRSVSGKYEWVNPNKKITIKNNLEFDSKSEDCQFVIAGKAFSCPKIEVNVFKKSPIERKKDITAFVWQSGNDDDEVKKAYLTDEDNVSPYNKYSYIMDCLSSHTMYRSMVSLTKFTSYNAARYAVRTLAKQPKGNRCFSIDGNNLVFLMGGAMFKIETIVTNAYAEDRNVTDEEFQTIEDLYAINGSHLFFDNPVKDVTVEQAEISYYMKNVLGIEAESQDSPNTKPTNGCDAIKRLLTSLFAEIKGYGIELDYVYCDIEGPWNDVRALAARRFSSRYVSKYPDSELDKLKGHVKLTETGGEPGKLKLFFDKIVITDLQKRKDLWEEMQHRGFSLSEKTMGDLALATDEQDNGESLYGLSRYLLTYERRRNSNIWDAVMKGYENGLFYQYVIKPVIESHPQAKCSVFGHANAKGYINHAKRFETYLGGSVQQNPEVYSCSALYGNMSGEYYKKLCMDNWKMYPNKRNFFSYFVGNINVLRSLLVSSQTEELKNGRFNAFIGSFNMWVNGYLANDDFVDSIRNLNTLKTDNDFIEKLDEYYKEFLFHVFLCCPDKVNAYFYVEKKAIRDQGRTDDGGSYYFPFDDPNNDNDENGFKAHKAYYTDSYSRLQEVLKELNDLIGGNPCVTTVKTLATETEPFVASGVEFADKTLWRITLDEPGSVMFPIDYLKPGDPSFGISTSKGTIWFYNTEIPSWAFNYHRVTGMWIVTTKGEKPVFKADADFYESNPAFVKRPVRHDGLVDEVKKYSADMAREMKKFVENEVPGNYIEKKVNKKMDDENVVGLSAEQLRALKERLRQEVINELVAENKKKKVDNLEFSIVNNYLRYKLPRTFSVFGETPEVFTWSLKFKVNKVGDVCSILLFRSDEGFDFVLSGNSDDLEVWIEKRSDGSKTGNEKLVVGGHYELKKYVAIRDGVTADPLNGLSRFELWRLTDNGKKQLVLAADTDFSYDNPSHCYFYQTYLDVLHPITDVISVEEFKAYLSQQHEKLEIFRESDGVNIGRLTQEADFQNAPCLSTYGSDGLIGKFSWVNATNQPQEYTIICKVNSSVVPLDEQFRKIEVNANSEGYVLIPLPKTTLGTTVMELTYRKKALPPSEDSNSPSEDSNGKKAVSFFTTCYKDHYEKTVIVRKTPIK